tara:strand:+ start:4519 stop:5589 length:1071 start_codon:yes stop_codon:yes gene_type:complete
MNILYGIAATGNGHISRSRVIVDALRKKGHSIDVLLSGRDKKDLFDIDDLKPFEVKKGFTFVTKKGKISYIKTLLESSLIEFFNDIKSIDNSYDLVITDLEPISAYAAKVNKIPCIGIGHQYSFYKKIPMKINMKFASIFIPKMYSPVNFSIPFHFHHFNQLIFPPIIDPIFYKELNNSQYNGNILVYLSWEDLNDMISILEKISNNFIIYTKIKSIKKHQNITLKPFSNLGFKKDLMQCSGLITNGGFELPSEALFLGKPMLCKPLGGQPEQQHNAEILQELGYATICDKIDVNNIENWIKNKINVRIPFKNPIDLIINIIENPTIDFSDQIIELWENNTKNAFQNTSIDLQNHQ